jgi:hypothetical protein
MTHHSRLPIINAIARLDPPEKWSPTSSDGGASGE